jgi:hypothetical protein
LNAKTRTNTKSVSDAADSCVISAGEIFPDGAMIETVSSSSGLPRPDLLLWNGGQATIGPRVKHRGFNYEALALPPSLYRATRLPSKCGDYGSARALFEKLTDLFEQHLGLPERECNLLACFSISSWLADRLPTAPGLMISGPNEELGIDVLRLLSCVCRHPLMLAEITPGAFRSLPMHLSLTLLLHQQGLSPNMQRLFRASNHRGLSWPGNRGGVIDLYGPKAIFCGNNAAVNILGAGEIHITVPPTQRKSSVLDELLQSEIADQFQPLLLMYRLKNAPKVRQPQVDISNFTFATRQLAYTLALCFPNDLKLARDMVLLLQPLDEEARGQRYCDVDYVIVEVLLAMIHHQEQRDVGVSALAKEVNALLRSRGETVEYGAEEIGWKLHNLNIPRHRSSSGQLVLLGQDTSQSVHRLANFYDLRCPQDLEADCPDCDQGQAALSKQDM